MPLIQTARDRYRAISLPAKAALWFTACSIISRGISVISMPIFTRLFTTEQYGEYSLYVSWEMVIALFVTLNLYSEVFSKGLSDYEDERDAFVSGQMGLLTVLCAAWYLIYFIFRDYVNSFTGLSTVLTTFAFLDSYTTGILGMWFARKRFEYAYKALVGVTLLNSACSVLLGFVAVALAPETLKVLARVATNSGMSVVIAVVLLVSTAIKSGRFFQPERWRWGVVLSVPLVPHYLSQVLLNQSDKVMIGWFCSNTEVAVYSVAHSAGLLLVLVNSGINSSFVPWSYTKIKEGHPGDIAGAATSLCCLTVVFNACLMLIAPEAVALLATEEYAGAIWSIAPIAASVVFCFIYQLFVNVEVYYGKVGYVAVASIFAAGLNVALNYLLIPVFGYVAAGFTTLFSYFMTMVLHGVFLKRTLAHVGAENPYDLRGMALCCVAILACMASIMASYLFLPLRLGLIAMVVIVLVLRRNTLLETIKSIRGKKGHADADDR